ncbi:MAG: aminopeptidase P family protein [Armatimonadetes bacterium]|nr:aminopeptidase P family protein [Armatimonadota bacterium]
MHGITAEKIRQAQALVKDSGVDLWLTFVRETSDGGDPVLPLLIEGGLTWQSALIIAKTGERVAIVGNYDAEPLEASGDWDEVVPYDEGIRGPLLETLERLIPAEHSWPKIAVNFSTSDPKADGLSHGMYLLLQEYLDETRFEGRLVSGEDIAGALRSQKTPTEIARTRAAIAETGRIFSEVRRHAKTGMTERALYDFIQRLIEERGMGYAWDKHGDPIVNTGPDSMIGHGVPSAKIKIEPGHILHIDLGVQKDGYCSDIQRCWLVPGAIDDSRLAIDDSESLPEDVSRAFDAVTGAISAGAEALKPGALGWRVDEAARSFLKETGFPEYRHATGHQVGRTAHDGGALLGPKWDRYGRTPYMKVQENQVFTLELGVMVEGRGYLGIEEMVLVTEDGCEWLTERQLELPVLD